MDVKIARVFSAYGEGLRKQIFWDMYKKSKESKKLDMFGTGTESRDYIHIDDVVQAIYLIAERASKDETVYNVANGEEISIRMATECFADAAGINRDRISFDGNGKEGNPINWRADISKLKSLGYQKQIGFREGIKSYVEWTTHL